MPDAPAQLELIVAESEAREALAQLLAARAVEILKAKQAEKERNLRKDAA